MLPPDPRSRTSAGRAPVLRRDIDAALAARGLSPLHRFGQNFLVRPEVLDRVVALATPGKGDVVLEVGPGLGGLTERLLAAGPTVVAVEIDRGLFEHLRATFGAEPGLRLVHADILDRKSSISAAALAALEEAPPGRFVVVSNLPYGISSPFLVALARLARSPERIVVTVQKEVADVLRAEPGSDAWSPLSFVARLTWAVSLGPRLSPEAFHPRPRVESAVVVLDALPEPSFARRDVIALGRRLLNERRKTLGSTLGRLLAESESPADARSRAESALREAGLDPSARAETVEPLAVARLLGILPGLPRLLAGPGSGG